MSLFRNPPKTRYADTGEGFVGYVVFGDGPPDILFATQMVTNVEMMWESPHVSGFFDQLATCGRVVLMEYRGIGVSDPFPLARNPTFDDILTDGKVVMEAAGFTDGVAVGDVEAGPVAMMMAATYPERIDRLVLINTYPRLLRDEDYPIGVPHDTADRLVQWVRDNWATPEFFAATAPSISDDERLLDWLVHFQRLAVSPGEAGKLFEWFRTIDVRSILGSIHQPTLVITRTDAQYHRPAFGRYLAEHIPNATMVELPGADTSPYYLADTGPVLEQIEEFLTGETTQRPVDRILATVMFTDIVESTNLAAKFGDSRWLALLDEHNRLTGDYVEKYGGREISTTGDGVLATFDGPTRAITCAAHLGEALSNLGVDIRIGLHTGEIELREDDIGGVAVHIAARVMAEASGSTVLVSSTVKDLVAGSGIEFDSLGVRELKGVPGTWELFELSELPTTFR